MQPQRKNVVGNPPPPPSPAPEANPTSSPSPSLVSKPMEDQVKKVDKEDPTTFDKTNMAYASYNKRNKLDSCEPTNMNPFKKLIPLLVKMTSEDSSNSSHYKCPIVEEKLEEVGDGSNTMYCSCSSYF